MPEQESKLEKQVVINLPDFDETTRNVYTVIKEGGTTPLEAVIQPQKADVDGFKHTAAKWIATLFIGALVEKGIEVGYDSAVRAYRDRKSKKNS